MMRVLLGFLMLIAVAGCAQNPCAKFVGRSLYDADNRPKSIAYGSDRCFAVWARSDQSAADGDALAKCDAAGGSGCKIVYRGDRSVANNDNQFAHVLGAVALGAMAAYGNNSGMSGLSSGLSTAAMLTPRPVERSIASSSRLIEAQSPNCKPVPARCDTAQQRGQSLLARFPQTSGISDSASQLYCGLLIGVKTNTFCAQMYRAEGRSKCAGLIDRQASADRASMVQVQRTLDASSVSRIRQACSWEN